MRRNSDRQRRVASRQLLDGNRVRDRVGARPAVLLRNRHPHQPELAELGHELIREPLLAVELLCDRSHLLERKLPDRVPEQELAIPRGRSSSCRNTIPNVRYNFWTAMMPLAQPAPRRKPRRDRRTDLPHLSAARDRDGRRCRARRRRGAAHARRRPGRPGRLVPRRRRARPFRTRRRGRRRPPRLRLPGRERRIRRRRHRRRTDVDRPAARGLAARRRQARARSGSPARRACRTVTGGRSGGDRLPALVKAAAGGGGRGMRIVRDAEALDEALAAAAREAEAAFGDGTVFCERYLERPRHVEVQLIADAARNVVALGRARLLRPAPPPEGRRGGALPRRSTRARAAHRAPRSRFAAAVGYVGAGTAEFLVDGGELLLPRAERPHPGRAPGHRGRHGPRPRRAAAPRRRGEPLDLAAPRGPRGRGPALRRGSPQASSLSPARSSSWPSRRGSGSTPASPQGDAVGWRTTR